MVNKLNVFKEVDFIDGVQEFIESEYITEQLGKSLNTFILSSKPTLDSIRFSGDISLFKKQVYNVNDLILEGSWMVTNVNGIYKIIINENLRTSEFTYTFVTYKTRAETKKEGLFSVDYLNGILYLSTALKNYKVSYRYSTQYIEGQEMEQVPPNEYNKNTLYNISVDSESKLAYTYQLKNTQINIKTKEYLSSPRVSLVTLGDKDE